MLNHMMFIAAAALAFSPLAMADHNEKHRFHGGGNVSYENEPDFLDEDDNEVDFDDNNGYMVGYDRFDDRDFSYDDTVYTGATKPAVEYRLNRESSYTGQSKHFRIGFGHWGHNHDCSCD